MKLEIEVSEAELKDALARHVRAAVADRVNHWGASDEIKKLVQAKYKETVEAIVVESLANSKKIREQVEESIAAKIRGQLTALMREKK